MRHLLEKKVDVWRSFEYLSSNIPDSRMKEVIPSKPHQVNIRILFSLSPCKDRKLLANNSPFCQSHILLMLHKRHWRLKRGRASLSENLLLSYRPLFNSTFAQFHIQSHNNHRLQRGISSYNSTPSLISKYQKSHTMAVEAKIPVWLDCDPGEPSLRHLDWAALTPLSRTWRESTHITPLSSRLYPIAPP